MAAEDRYRKFVIEYFNCGGNQTQAAINAGYSPRSAYMQGSRLMKNDKVKKLMEEYKKDIYGNLRTRMAAGAVKAYDAILSIATNPRADDRDRLAAAKDIMDRAGYKPVDKTEVSGGLSVTLEVDDDIDAQD